MAFMKTWKLSGWLSLVIFMSFVTDVKKVSAQDIGYARMVIDSLCSPGYFGRGYAFRGDSIAANFIVKQFMRAGIEPAGKGYFQPFEIPVNIFPGKMEVRFDRKTLVPGKDYIVSPGSPSIHGTYRVLELSPAILSARESLLNFLERSSGKIIYINKTDFIQLGDSVNKVIRRLTEILKNITDYSPAAVVVAGKDKLVWSTATEVDKRPVIFTNVIPDKIRKVRLEIQEKFIDSCRTQNIIGRIGPENDSDSVMVVTAHYDHLGMMGKDTRFPGANDNASGTALMLDLAKELNTVTDSLRFPVLFIAFSGEEAGLLGSGYFVSHPVIGLDKIKFLINLDLAGTGDDGITVVNATVFKKEYERLTEINNRYHLLPAVKSRGEACNSDHCFFYREGVPCFFIYTLGGIQAYHDIYDRPETLPLTAYDNYFRLLKRFILDMDGVNLK